MPKVEKPRPSASARGMAPTRPSHPSSSSKKKKSSSNKKASKPSHASLETDLARLADPGKLKPIKSKTGGVAAGGDKKKNSEEMKLENQLLTSSSKGKKQTAAASDDAMYDDADEDGDAAIDSDAADDDAQNEADAAATIPARMTKKILQSVHAQQKEEGDQEGEEEEATGANNSARRLRQVISLKASASGNGGDSDLEDAGSDEDEDDEDDDGRDFGMDDVELSAEDQASLEMFMPTSSAKSKSLSEMILEKIREKELEAAGSAGPAAGHGSNVHFGAGFGAFGSAAAGGAPDAGDMVRAKLDPKIVEVYTKVGKFLSHYTSGKIPKAFKLIPNLRSWEEILFLTSPDGWTSQAHFVATRIFSSNFNPKMAQRFYSMILLPKVRNDIESNKHLNYHLYQAIKKSLYKPAAFFKGLLLPLAEQGATPREAVIMSSILSKCTIPVLHSSVALLKLAQMPYSGTTALFMKTLLNKKYSLPLKVIAGLVQYFCTFLHHSAAGASVGNMPLIWHQTLLSFVQRYKLELTPNQVAAVKNLVKVQQHHAVTQEIRREMLAVGQGAAASSSSSAAAAGSRASITSSSSFVFGTTAGFTSLAASMKNLTAFSIPTSMEQ